MLCQICGFLGYCFLQKSGFGTHIQTHKLKKQISFYCEIKLIHIFNDDLLKKNIWQATEW